MNGLLLLAGSGLVATGLIARWDRAMARWVRGAIMGSVVAVIAALVVVA